MYEDGFRCKTYQVAKSLAKAKIVVASYDSPLLITLRIPAKKDDFTDFINSLPLLVSRGLVKQFISDSRAFFQQFQLETIRVGLNELKEDLVGDAVTPANPGSGPGQAPGGPEEFEKAALRTNRVSPVHPYSKLLKEISLDFIPFLSYLRRNPAQPIERTF